MTTTPLGRGAGRPIQSHAFDIQAIVGSGFAPLRHCTYHFLCVDDRALACRWLRNLLSSHLVKSVADLGRMTDDARDRKRIHREVATVGFTHEGLRRFGLRATDDRPFPTPFTMGATHPLRAGLVGDTNVRSWNWGDHADPRTAPPHADVVVAHFRRLAEVDAEGPFAPRLFEPRASGLVPVVTIESCPAFIERVTVGGRHERQERQERHEPHEQHEQHEKHEEHEDHEQHEEHEQHDRYEWRSFEPFGFRDSLSQPVVDGLRPFAGSLDPAEPRGASSADDVINPGEFVLGHLTEYDEPSYCPNVEGWGDRATIDGQPSSFGLNGTYLAIRQIVQDVAGFAALDEPRPGVTSVCPTMAEKMMGRRKDGRPLQTVPTEPTSLNRFRYRLNDAEGFQCPLGAHIRRANPRDTLGWDTPSGIKLSKRHRILRRGRVFTGERTCCDRDCGDPSHRPACGRGVLFIALNGDLERQFELILKRWLNNPSFNQYCASDPIVGAGAEPGEFPVPALPIGRADDAMPFTSTVGAGYFFVPSLTALQFIASRA